MCTCGHGSDRHYLDYAGPGICGGVLGKCLDKDCGCEAFVAMSATLHPISLTIWPSTAIHQTNHFSSAG